MISENHSLADILGPWKEPDRDSGLISRCRGAWNKPLRDLSSAELATLLRQRMALEHVVPAARNKLAEGRDDGTEIYEGELATALRDAVTHS